MLTHFHRLLGRTFKAFSAGILVVTLMVLSLPGASSQALAAPKAPLSETMDLKMTKAAQEYVEAILDEYADALDGSFAEALKPLKSVTKDLTKQLGKAAAAPESISATRPLGHRRALPPRSRGSFRDWPRPRHGPHRA